MYSSIHGFPWLRNFSVVEGLDNAGLERVIGMNYMKEKGKP